MYNGALADMSLANDPFTGNRYAFTGGNPVSNVEIDGHFAIALPFIAAALVVVAAVVVVAVVVLAVAVVAEKAVEEIKERIDEADEAEPEPEPGRRPPGPGTDKTDQRKAGCTKDGKGWVEHGALDPANGNRSTGVTACLTGDNIGGGTATAPDSVTPPGYRWAQRYAGHLGADPSKVINACHLLGKQLGGSGTDLKNLATCSKDANYTGTSMRTYENQVRSAVEAGQEVLYTVTPAYQGNRTVPSSFTITAYGTNPDGTPGITINTVIPNTLDGKNLGIVTDKSGVAVPTGATP